MTDPKRPDCWGFAMSFVGDPEAQDIERYVSVLESEIKRLRADAARWQAIRRHGAIIPSFHAFCLMQGDALNAAIYSISEELLLDAAMKDTQ